MRTVIVDAFDRGRLAYGRGYAVVAVDVIRSVTTAVTAVALGRRCLPVPSLEAALALAKKLDRPLLAGEVSGLKPPGFDFNNSPAEIAALEASDRPLVLLSSSGTRLICEAAEADAVYLGCFRNAASLAAYLATRHPAVALVGAATRGEFREEDQICCAWIAADLCAAGYAPADARTAALIARWRSAPAEACLVGNSAAFLKRSGQTKDLDFILAHINDLHDTFLLREGEIRAAKALPEAVAA